MVSDSCVVKRLVEHELDIVFPQSDEIERINEIIVNELSINIIRNESKSYYVRVMEHLCDKHQVEGIILGCTGKSTEGKHTLNCVCSLKTMSDSHVVAEIPLLVNRNDFSRVPLFDSTQLHVKTIVRRVRLHSMPFLFID
jgi:aspartate/glutamate racemase